MTEEERVRAACGDHGEAGVEADGCAVPRNVSRPGLEADEAPAWPVLLDLRQRITTDEVPFRQLDRPAQPGFVRIDRFIHVVSIKAQRGLEPCRVARAETCRQHAFALALCEDRVPHLAYATRLYEQLESVLAGIAGP